MMDRTDEEILYYLEHGRTNAYQVWRAMDNESNGLCIVYKNVYCRLMHLFEDGIIERIETPEINLHARKDFRVTKKGRQDLRDHIDRLEQILK